jgi:signal transduction histidine kinase
LFVTSDARRIGTLWQILLLAAGFLVLVAISAASALLVDRSRDDSAAVVHTIEVQDQTNALLLDVRRAESAARGYLLTSQPEFLADHRAAVAVIPRELNALGRLTTASPVQTKNVGKLRNAVEAQLDRFVREMRRIKAGDRAGAATLVREAATSRTADTIHDVARAMLTEENRTFAVRAISAHRIQQITSAVTFAGSGLVIIFTGLSMILLRRSAKARDAAEALLRDTNLNLEATVDERTADLREANDEIQRFAHIVGHDLRSPLINIMGFTSELEELRTDIFRRLSTLSRTTAASTIDADAGPVIEASDLKLSEEFGEALGFIKSSIGKMDRLISAILNLNREGRRRFDPVAIDTRQLIEGIVATLAHQASEAKVSTRVAELPDIVGDRLALEQIFSNLIDNAIKYARPGVPGEISVRGRAKSGFAVFEVTDNGRGIDPRDHQRIFDLFRRAGAQDKPGQGLGLAHVRTLVRRLGGTISVASELNSGSTFTITLPIDWTVGNRKQDA